MMTERAEQLERETTAPASRRRGWLLVSLLLAGGMLAWVVVWLLGTDQGTQAQRLPDGATQSLLGYTYGPKQEFVAGVRWQKLLYPVLPLSWRPTLGGVTVRGRTAPPPGLFTVWTRYTPPPVQIHTGRIRYAAVDEHGCEFWTEHNGSYAVEVPGPEQLAPIAIETFPHRSPLMRVREYTESSPYTARCIAEFVVPNPAPGPYPTWPVPPLPISVTQDGLTFTLDRLVTGLRPGAKTGPLAEGEIPCSRFDYHVTQDGRTLDYWAAANMEWSDATGNHLQPLIRTIVAAPPHVRWYGWQGGLCTHEPYRLHVEFTSDGILDASDTWTVPNVRIPPRGIVRPANWTAERHGTRLHATQITGPGAKLPEWGQMDTYRPEASFFTLTGLQSGVSERLQLIRAVDARGRSLLWDPLDPGPAAYSTAGGAVFAIRTLPGVQTVNLTFGLRRSYYVDLVAQPVLPPAPHPQPEHR